MSCTVSTIQTDMNTYLGDASTDRISANERLQFITEATIWLQEELKNDHLIRTYDLSYVDTVNYYQVTTPLADLLEGADLRRRVGENFQSMTHKSARELAEEAASPEGDSWAIERRDGDTYLVVSATPKYRAISLDDFDASVTNWTADTTTSDLLNITLDTNEFSSGSGALNFDVDVSQSVNNRAGLYSTTITNSLASVEDTGVFLLDVFIPDVTYISSFTLQWGTTSSNYWSTTVTTDIDGNAFQAGKWITLAFEWSAASTVGSPTSSTIAWYRLDMNYSASQGDDTDFRIDKFRVAKPEVLTFHYASFVVGTSSGSDVYQFTSTSDIPYFSGKYDQYRKAVAHMAASIAFDTLRLKDDAMKEESRAVKALERARRIFPQSITKEIKSFKVGGINLNRRNR